MDPKNVRKVADKINEWQHPEGTTTNMMEKVAGENGDDDGTIEGERRTEEPAPTTPTVRRGAAVVVETSEYGLRRIIYNFC